MTGRVFTQSCEGGVGDDPAKSHNAPIKAVPLQHIDVPARAVDPASVDAGADAHEHPPRRTKLTAGIHCAPRNNVRRHRASASCFTSQDILSLHMSRDHHGSTWAPGAHSNPRNCNSAMMAQAHTTARNMPPNRIAHPPGHTGHLRHRPPTLDKGRACRRASDHPNGAQTSRTRHPDRTALLNRLARHVSVHEQE